jgi:hypothetical protein
VLFVALPLRLHALCWPAVPTRKSGFPTSAARASSKALTCLQTLSVSRLGRKVRSLLVAPVVASWFADVSCIGRNVIIEQSYGGPKITKGEPLFLLRTLSILFFCSFPFAMLDCMRVPFPTSYSFFIALLCYRAHSSWSFRWCHGCQGHYFEGQIREPWRTVWSSIFLRRIY